MRGPRPAIHRRMDTFAFLLIDVDGYCTGGIDQRRTVSPGADGYRAREMGWVLYTEDVHASGSVYFYDKHVPGLAEDANVWYAQGMHGLPIRPSAEEFEGEPALCSSQLLPAIRAVHDAVAEMTALPVVIAHKGGNEGLWAAQAIPGVPTIDLGSYGCPKVDAIGKASPHLHVGNGCRFHHMGKRRAKKIIHCPRLEVCILADWLSRCEIGRSG